MTTIVSSAGDPLHQLAAVEMWAETGQYLTCDFVAPQVHLVNKNGSIATSITASGTNGAKINQDGTAWVIGRNVVSRVDLRQSTVTSLLTFTPGPGKSLSFTGIDVYGSRRLTCRGSGKPGTTVNITLSSRKPADAFKTYILACSFARRPSIDLGIGDRIHLTVDDPFLVSVGANNSMFARFLGVTGSTGEATAAVNIPSALQANLGITVFVAGIILDANNLVQTVTNTHWFVLS